MTPELILHSVITDDDEPSAPAIMSVPASAEDTTLVPGGYAGATSPYADSENVPESLRRATGRLQFPPSYVVVDFCRVPILTFLSPANRQAVYSLHVIEGPLYCIRYAAEPTSYPERLRLSLWWGNENGVSMLPNTGWALDALVHGMCRGD